MNVKHLRSDSIEVAKLSSDESAKAMEFPRQLPITMLHSHIGFRSLVNTNLLGQGRRPKILQGGLCLKC